MKKLFLIFSLFLSLNCSVHCSVSMPFWFSPKISTASSFTANTAIFDGTNDAMTNNVALTGVADGYAATFSCWVKFNGGDGVLQKLFVVGSGSAIKYEISKSTGNKITVLGASSGGTTKISFTSSNSIIADSTWHHFMCEFNRSTAVTNMWIDGVVDQFTVTTFVGNDGSAIDFLASRTTVGCLSGGANKINASIAELWFDDSSGFTVSQFYSGGHPITPPAGSALYLSTAGSGNSWNSDSSGNGNTFTLVGTLGTDTSP